jgi:hypothetical protein
LRRSPVARTTRRRSAPRSSRGTAAGSRYSMTAPCAGAPGDTSPAAVAARPAKMLTSAPLSAAPHDVFSSDLHASFISVSEHEWRWLCVPRPKETYHVPNAAAERRKAQLPQWSPAAMTGVAAAAPGGRRA